MFNFLSTDDVFGCIVTPVLIAPYKYSATTTATTNANVTMTRR